MVESLISNDFIRIPRHRIEGVQKATNDHPWLDDMEGRASAIHRDAGDGHDIQGFGVILLAFSAPKLKGSCSRRDDLRPCVSPVNEDLDLDEGQWANDKAHVGLDDATGFTANGERDDATGRCSGATPVEAQMPQRLCGEVVDEMLLGGSGSEIEVVEVQGYWKTEGSMWSSDGSGVGIRDDDVARDELVLGSVTAQPG